MSPPSLLLSNEAASGLVAASLFFRPLLPRQFLLHNDPTWRFFVAFLIQQSIANGLQLLRGHPLRQQRYGLLGGFMPSRGGPDIPGICRHVIKRNTLPRLI